MDIKCALVTGSTYGLGSALADFLESKGIKVIRTGRTSPTLPVDLAGDRQKLLEIISTECPDLIVNNAGFGLYGATIDLDIQEQLDMIEVNVKALVEISIHSAKTFAKAGKKGIILNISSGVAYLPAAPFFNLYGSTKAFVKCFSLSLDAELRDQGIRVLCACPGYIVTQFRKRASKGFSQFKKDFITMSPEDAVMHIWNQIQKRKRVILFDWRTKLLIWISRLIPRVLSEKIFKTKIKSLISSSSRDT